MNVTSAMPKNPKMLRSARRSARSRSMPPAWPSNVLQAGEAGRVGGALRQVDDAPFYERTAVDDGHDDGAAPRNVYLSMGVLPPEAV
jgi:hypothetical protein